MYSILVLGLVPGTNIQISFQMWLALSVSLVVVVILTRRKLVDYQLKAIKFGRRILLGIFSLQLRQSPKA